MTSCALHVLDCVSRALLTVMGSIAYINKAHIKIISAKKKNQQALFSLYSIDLVWVENARFSILKIHVPPQSERWSQLSPVFCQ